MATTIRTFARFGSDLAVTRYVGTVSAAPLGSADSWGSIDLQVRGGGFNGRDGDLLDLASIDGRENLAQALILRLLTRKGSLEPLGHPAYGSRLIELIGGENNATNRNLARLYTIEAISQERRVRKLLHLAVEPVPGQPDTIRIGFTVLPLGDDEPLALTLEVTL
jgi:hypothetical protein